MLLGALASGAASRSPEQVRAIAALMAIVWLPGYVLLNRLFPSSFAPAWRPAAAFVVGASVVAVVTTLLSLANAPFRVYAGALQLFIGLLYLIDWIAHSRRKTDDARTAGVPARWVIALIAVGVVAWLESPRLEPGKDAFDHIGYLRQIEATNDMRPPGVLANPVDESAGPPPDPRKGAFHPASAAMSRLAAVSPLAFWSWIPVLVFPLAFLSFAAFCRQFVSNGVALAACLAMFLLSYGGVGLHFVYEVINGQNLSLVWYWLLVPAALAGASVRRAWLFALLGLGGTLVHLGVAVHAAVLGVTLVAFAPWLGQDRRQATRATAALAGGVLVGVLLRVAGGERFGLDPNFLHAQPQGVLFTGGGGFVMSPIEILRQHGLLFLGGLAALPVTAAWVRRRPEARRQVAFAVIPLAIVFVPLWTPLLYEAGSYMVFRTLLNVPAFAASLTAATGLVLWAHRGGWGRRVQAGVVLVAWALLFLTPSLRAFVRLTGSDNGNFLASQRPLLQALASLPHDGVVMSDTRSSYIASAVTDHRVVAVAEQHGNPYDPFAGDRIQATRDVLSPFVDGALVVSACEKFGVDFVICNGQLPVEGSDPLVPWDWRFYDQSVARLGSISGRFRQVYEKDRVTVFLYDAAGTGESKWGGIPLPMSMEDPGVEACELFAPDSTFAITGIRVHPPTVIPGDTVTVSVGYYKWSQPDVDFPLILHLRMDHASIAASQPYPGEKYVRRFVERWDDRLRRFRADHVPFEGFIDRSLWPIGIEFYETFALVVPRNVARGSYRVELSFERGGFLPNFAVSDFLYNRDHYSGVACAELEVADQVVR